MAGYCFQLCCFLTLVAAGVQRTMTTSAVWRKRVCFPEKCPSSSCIWCRLVWRVCRVAGPNALKVRNALRLAWLA